MTSIRHFPAGHPLPDWRNFGVMLRALLGVNALAASAALVMAPDLARWPGAFLDLAGGVELLLLAGLGLAAALRDLLWRLPLRIGQGVLVALAGVLAAGTSAYAQSLGLVAVTPARNAVLAMGMALAVLGYFELRAGRLSPALAEARLAALTARIRPHFLFNSLNAVLSLIRARPQQAEAALESLADLFRAAMRDPSGQVSLADEIALGRQYIELERLRLGDRLQVDWQIGPVPSGVPIPPLLLQPLLENAVYHGIEPVPEGGVIEVMVRHDGENLVIEVDNPVGRDLPRSSGNRMALANLRERLDLFYDLEASLAIEESPTRYRLRITLPCSRRAH